MMKEENSPAICRLCLKPDSDLENVLLPAKENYIEKIFQCTTIMIESTDSNLPATLCTDCIKMIDTIHNYRQTVINNQLYFIDQTKFETTEIISIKDENYEVICGESAPIIITEITVKTALTDDEEIGAVEEQKSDNDEYVPPKQKSKRRRPKPKPSPKEIDGSTTKKRTSKYADGSKYKKLQLPCETCGQMMNRSRLEAHRNLHSGLLPYKCDVENCDKAFNDRARLQGHKRDYHSNNCFECKICGKKYSVLNSLHSHSIVHMPPRHKCPFCDKKFMKSAYLKIHVRTHTGEKPYKCTYCDKTYAKPDNLTVHLRSHTRERPYKCSLCASCYSVNHSLKKHMEKCHPNS